jgi:sugar O-acyltransferase (sialic acid O-acetyltransferase NeuD family)
MKNLAIYGAGGFGREIACLINEINQAAKQSKWNFIGFFDDGISPNTKNEYGKIIGGIKSLNAFDEPLAIVIAIGDPVILKRIISKISNRRVEFPNIIAPDIRYLDENNKHIGRGNIFFSKCSLSVNVRIGDFNIFNSAIAIGHDVIIGNYNSFMPGTKISGEVIIGDLNFFGVNSVVLQRNKIGTGTTVGAGSVIMRDTNDNSTYIGNPAIKLNY